MKSQKLILTLSWIIVITTLLTLIVVFNKFGVITGRATDTGEANLTINTSASISFVDNSVNWGSGSVDETPSFAILDTNGTTAAGTAVINGSWNNETTGLMLRNDGNVNVSVDLVSSKDAAAFIGGTNPAFKWAISNNETGSCAAGIANTGYTDVNTTAPGTRICDDLQYADSNDELIIDLYVRVPEDALGTKGAVITATGTALA